MLRYLWQRFANLFPDLQCQRNDPVVCQLHASLLQSSTSPKGHKWHHHPLRRYRQIWSQLLIEGGIFFRKYTPGATVDTLLVPNCSHFTLYQSIAPVS